MLITKSAFIKGQDSSEKLKLNKIAYNLIKENIIEGNINPGTFLSEKELTEKLGISRTPVREALQRLETEKFLRIYPKRGVFVPEVSLKDIHDIYSIREKLEPYAARLATGNVAADEIEKYKKIFDTKSEPIDSHEFILIDHEFHKTIFKHSNNDYLITILFQFYDHQRRIRNNIANAIYQQREEIYKEHLSIIEALLQQNKNEVEQTMMVHLTNATNRMMKHFYINSDDN